MSQQSPPPPPPPPPPGRSSRGSGSGSGSGGREQQIPRWAIWVLAGALVAMFILPSLFPSDDRTEIPYSDLPAQVAEDKVEEITWSNNGGSITGTLEDGTEFSSNGPTESP